MLAVENNDHFISGDEQEPSKTEKKVWLWKYLKEQ